MRQLIKHSLRHRPLLTMSIIAFKVLILSLFSDDFEEWDVIPKIPKTNSNNAINYNEPAHRRDWAKGCDAKMPPEKERELSTVIMVTTASIRNLSFLPKDSHSLNCRHECPNRAIFELTISRLFWRHFIIIIVWWNGLHPSCMIGSPRWLQSEVLKCSAVDRRQAALVLE